MAVNHTGFVDTPQELEELCAQLRGEKCFAFDTEFITENTYVPQLCLIQVATAQRLVIIDPLAVADLSEFWDLAVHAPGEVIAHAAEAELRFCRQFTGQMPVLFDVQVAAGLVGYGFPMSYPALVRRVLDQSVLGGETRTDWRRRPLSDKQIHYAFEDVRHLLDLHGRLRAMLDAKGRRDWAREEFERRTQGVEREKSEAWRRVSRVHRLNRRQLAILRELVIWREEAAIANNRPLRSIATDDLLCEIARRQPHDVQDLLVFRGMNRRHLRKAVPLIMECVRRGLELPEEQCPTLTPRPDDSESVRLLSLILSSSMACICAEQEIAPGIAGSSAELAAFVRQFLKSDHSSQPSPFRVGWRAAVFGQVFQETLQGEKCLRVTDPAGDLPVSLVPWAKSRSDL